MGLLGCCAFVAWTQKMNWCMYGLIFSELRGDDMSNWVHFELIVIVGPPQFILMGHFTVTWRAKHHSGHGRTIKLLWDRLRKVNFRRVTIFIRCFQSGPMSSGDQTTDQSSGLKSRQHVFTPLTGFLLLNNNMIRSRTRLMNMDNSNNYFEAAHQSLFSRSLASN